MKTKITIITSMILMLSIAWGALGQEGVTVVPEIFLRSYDPVTIFFPEESRLSADEPADDPGELLQIEPDHPGEYRWLDAKTLQFLPTVRWPRPPAIHDKRQRGSAPASYADGSAEKYRSI